VTVVPLVPAGTSIVQLNAPDASVVRDPLEQVEMTTESKTNDPRAVETENPVPDTVTVAPTGPCVGFTTTLGTVTANAPFATWPPASVAETVVPVVNPGTANVHEKLPAAPVVSEPLVQLETGTESKVSEASAVDTEKPVPETVTVAPTGPWPGLTTIAGTVSVKLAVAVSAPASLPVATTLWLPAAMAGTVKVHEKVPVPEVVWAVQVWVAGVAPLYVNVPIVLAGVNPAPVTVTETPVGPCVGFTAIVGVVTVNATVAVSDPASLPVATALWLPAATTGTTKVHENVPVPDVVWAVQVWDPGVAPL
jgi:hypothetical protein